MTRQLKLGIIPTGVGGPSQTNRWLDPDIPADASVDVKWYAKIARQAEEARFDFVFIVDSQFITPHSPPHYLNRLEPLTLLSALAMTTGNIGLVGTFTTSYNDPFNLARRLASLDRISRGRAGWNVVTSGDAGTAGNFSQDAHFDYDTRYRRASEFVEVARGLWRSYEDDAFVRDRDTATFLDRSKQHALDHKGEFFSVVGPLNIERSPQGEHVIFQAGDSEPGRDLGAEIADAIFTQSGGFETARAFYREMKARAAKKGRDPDGLLILPGFQIIVGDTDGHAREIERHYQIADQDFDQALSEFGRPFGWHDFTQYDVDAPFPAHTLEHAKASFYTQARQITETAVRNGLTLRQVVQSGPALAPGPMVGSARTVANEIERWFEQGALDGLNVHLGHPAMFDRFVGEVIPILQDRGLVRREYEATTLRGNLGLDIPANRRSAAPAAIPTPQAAMS